MKLAVLVTFFLASTVCAQSIEEMKKMDNQACMDACMFRAIKDESCKSLSRCADQCHGVCEKPKVADNDISVVTNVLVSQDLPVVLRSYQTSPRDRDGDGRYDGVIHSIEYVSPDSTRELEAVEITFMLFDVWNKHITTVRGSHMSRLVKLRTENAMSGLDNAMLDDADRRTWRAAWTQDLGVATTERLWTTVAFISKIRFKEGPVLESNWDDVKQTLIKEGLVADNVEPEEVETITTIRI